MLIFIIYHFLPRARSKVSITPRKYDRTWHTWETIGFQFWVHITCYQFIFPLFKQKSSIQFYTLSTLFHFFVRPNKNAMNIWNLYLLLMSFDFSTFHWWFVFPFSSRLNRLSFYLRIKHSTLVGVEVQWSEFIQTIESYL